MPELVRLPEANTEVGSIVILGLLARVSIACIANYPYAVEGWRGAWVCIDSQERLWLRSKFSNNLRPRYW
ncbi:hypothetical protein Sinac_0106 [Singulisphaera acidiphila DSM 18658]|uniref:Uncharacterized protein n=1 Tax=Singulisphaera acidiphila (strain ATCC BAA-1392 / DSM 18658 / VKM B-2454 / MOB10) TaxID=886293 RepID=L0D5N1_SINAD|nr:hypothetical protein Sinac_0106 [Singulisphaera acidiphila DSM 18658]